MMCITVYGFYIYDCSAATFYMHYIESDIFI